MRQIKVLALALFACLAVSAVATAVASAEKPEFKPAEKNAFTAAGGEALFEQKEGLAGVKAASSEGSGEVINAKEGSWDELFLKSTAPLSGNCTGLNDTVVGSILAKGKFKIGYDLTKTIVLVALKLEPEVHFECESLIKLVTVRGAVVCELTPKNTDTKEFLVLCKQTKGVQQFTDILNATNTADETYKLESEINGGVFTQSGQNAHVKLTVTKLAEIVA